MMLSVGVRGFPTFHFYVSQRKVDELVGADQNQLRQKIEQWKQSAFNPFASAGMSLGGPSAALSAEDAREARLKRFNNVSIVPPPAASVPSAAAVAAQASLNVVCDPATGVCRPKEDTEETKGEDVEMSEEADMGLPPVNEELLASLADMGFVDLHARKALLATDSQSLEAAITWLGDHQEDADIDDPIKFVDLSKLIPLTPEEKEAKVAALKAKIQQKRIEREEREKREKVESEIKRRTMGQGIQEAKEEYDALQRKLAAERQRKEKEDFKRERERLRHKIEMDKLERRARGGKLGGAPIDLPSVETLHTGEQSDEKKKPSPVSTLTPKEQVVTNVQKLKQYRVAGDGLTAVKTLLVYVKNLLEKPEDEKFRTINLENQAFRKRVASLVGGVAFLKALGYEKDEADGMLRLSLEKRDNVLLQYARTVLEGAVAELTNAY